MTRLSSISCEFWNVASRHAHATEAAAHRPQSRALSSRSSFAAILTLLALAPVSRGHSDNSPQLLRSSAGLIVAALLVLIVMLVLFAITTSHHASLNRPEAGEPTASWWH